MMVMVLVMVMVRHIVLDLPSHNPELGACRSVCGCVRYADSFPRWRIEMCSM
jgi:hypothetical protein